MPRSQLDRDEIAAVLERCELARIAFAAGESVYLIPLAYVWLDGKLYGATDRGWKTELAAADPRVAFQVDTSREDGLFEWESVTGRGRFSVVTDAPEREAALERIQSIMARAPAWWRAEQGPRMAEGGLIVWRIEPAEATGIRYAPKPGDAC